jgi:tRNA modification GTPase
MANTRPWLFGYFAAGKSKALDTDRDMDSDRDTIYALSSGRPPAAIAVVRISGPQAGAALQSLIGRLPPPRQAVFARLRDPATKETIDQGLALWFPGPRSATGDDVAELHLHGGRAVVAAVLEVLGRTGGCRPAEPGEFTRRSFENGRLDLTQVEGLADLIAADTQAQRRQAVRQIGGWLGNKAEAWRTQLVAALALVEARIDFVDEADVPEDLVTPALAGVRALREEMAMALADQWRGERLREGVTVAIAGPPNAGKSSLINRIARREAAIVSPYAGTTRDVIEVHLDLGGVPVVLLDTAGIREGGDPVEQEGVRRARARAAGADLVLWVVDATGTDASMLGLDHRPGDTATPRASWIIVNKIDKIGQPTEIIESMIRSIDYRSFYISALKGEGVDALLEALTDFVAEEFAGIEPALITRERHRIAVQDAVAALDVALAESPDGREEIIAEELRLAARALARLIGRVDVEDVLDVIFRDFCIGK